MSKSVLILLHHVRLVSTFLLFNFFHYTVCHGMVTPQSPHLYTFQEISLKVRTFINKMLIVQRQVCA